MPGPARTLVHLLVLLVLALGTFAAAAPPPTDAACGPGTPGTVYPPTPGEAPADCPPEGCDEAGDADCPEPCDPAVQDCGKGKTGCIIGDADCPNPGPDPGPEGCEADSLADEDCIATQGAPGYLMALAALLAVALGTFFVRRSRRPGLSD